MVPASLQRLIHRLRTRERALAMSWRSALALAGCAGLILLACLIDYLVDRRIDTPFGLRVALLVVQVAAWLGALGVLVATFLHKRGDDQLALRIEDKVPSLGHRLISALQLNRAGAKVEGMSPALIAAVTREAEEQADQIDLATVAPGTRFRRAAGVGVLALLTLGLFAVFAPYTSAALVARLFLGDQEIPRAFALNAENPQVWPAGEDGVLRFRITGELPGINTVGEVRIDQEDAPPIRLALSHEAGDLWSARIPPLDEPFTYRAWLADVRLRQAGQMRYEPRPVVQSLQATVLLPTALLGKRPNGTPYEEPQRAGDVDFRLADCKARLQVTAQMPLEIGFVQIQGAKPRRLPLVLGKDPEKASVEFDLFADDRSYTVHLRNYFGFENTDPPKRSLRKLPLEAPEVALLPEQFYKEGDAGPAEDREVEGIPILLGERFALAYAATARYGLSHARIRYRVVSKATNTDEESGLIDREAFQPLPLGPARGEKATTAKAREEFSTKPPADADALPDIEGSGRYDFSSAGISDGKGGLLDLKEGDRIQFYVEAFSKADPEGTPGRSVVREKEVVDVKAYLSWLQRKEDLKERTRYLEEQQRMARPGGE